VILQHRLRKEKDPTTLMTTVYKRATPTHASRSLEDDTIVGLTVDNQILFWENQPNATSVEVDPLLIVGQSKGCMRVRYDLLDTFVDVCSVEVLQLFMDNFDYQNLRLDFMTGVLGDDITENKLYAHIVHNEYATRVKDLRTYASVSRDVIHRWTSPVVVENPLLLQNAAYRLQRGLVYRERGVKTHPSAVIGPDTVLGGGSMIGAKSIVRCSVIGRNCKIGANCHIINSFLWTGCIVEDNCVVEWGIVCSRAHLYENVTLGKGAVVSFDVCVGPNVNIKAHTRLTRQHVKGSVLGISDGEEITRNIDLGNRGVGVQWVLQEEEQQNQLHASGRKPLQLGDSEDDEPNDPISAETEDSEIVDASTLATDFDVEVREIAIDGIKANSSIENIVLEINGRKFAHDKSFFECARAVLWSLLYSVPQSVEVGKPLLVQFQALLKKWHGLLAKFVQSVQDQTELLWTLQEFVEFKVGSGMSGFVCCFILFCYIMFCLLLSHYSSGSLPLFVNVSIYCTSTL
jgi:translation initiation factor eIF-2B subunit epsilon